VWRITSNGDDSNDDNDNGNEHDNDNNKNIDKITVIIVVSMFRFVSNYISPVGLWRRKYLSFFAIFIGYLQYTLCGSRQLMK